jgi:serine/threonine-protein kinase ATR
MVGFFSLCRCKTNNPDSAISTAKNLEQLDPNSSDFTLPFAAEASWLIGRWDSLKDLINSPAASRSEDFNVGLGKAILAIEQSDKDGLSAVLKQLRRSISKTFTSSSTSSLSAAHGHLLKLHVLYEIDALSGLTSHGLDVDELQTSLSGRLDALASFTEDKQFILGIRRAIMSLSKYVYSTASSVICL